MSNNVIKEDDSTIKLAVVKVLIELHKASKKHGPFNSAHEGYAVLKEEVDELWDEIKKREPSKRKLKAEATQVAAMALRFLVDVCMQDD